MPPQDSISAAWQKFLSTTPEGDALANAEFALLRQELESDSTNASAQLCRFAATHRGVQTESGVPLEAVTLAVALGCAGPTGLNRELYEALWEQLATPSMLSAHLLTQAERLAEASPAPVRAVVEKLRQGWENEERLRELIRQLRKAVDLNGPLSTNVWVPAASGAWLALLEPNSIQTVTMADGQNITNTLAGTHIRFVPARLLQTALCEYLRDAAATSPKYFSLAAAVERRHFCAFPQEPKRADRSLELLATITEAGPPPPRPGGRPRVAGFRRDSSSPHFPVHFVLSIYLADPAALYASQRQRALWSGALILAAAGAALIGFVRARRAFLGEHQLSELKTNFVSSVSHELRAPIASVRLMAESLERGKVQEPAKQLEYYRFIVQECRRLASLIANVLDFSRIEQGRKQYEFEPADIVLLVRETVKLMEPSASEREVGLDVRCSVLPAGHGTTDPQPMLDGRAIQQALLNLIDNALKHSPKGSVVTVGLEPRRSSPPTEHGGFRLWVEDQGPGIPASEQDRIFERFYRLGSELRRETQGVGIGLSIVKHIVEAHRGQVFVESALGKGSRFIIELPAGTQLLA